MSTPTSSPVQTGSAYPTALNYRFNASMAIIVVVLVTTFFFLGLFVLYVRRCNRDSDVRADGSLQRAYWREREGVGVEPEMVQKLPLMRFASVKGRKKGKVGFECVVCLVEFEEEEKLKLLPTCGHSFHPQCIDMWLQSHTTCPLCRFSLVPLESAPPDPNLQADAQPVETGEPQDQTIPVSIIRTLSRNSESFKRAVQNLEHSPLRKSDMGSPSTPKLPPRSPLSAEESLRKNRMILLRSGLSRSVGHNSIANRPNWAEISEFATKDPTSGAGSVIINIDPVVGERTRNWREISGLPATPEHFEEEEAEKHSGFSFKRTFSLRRSSSDGKTIFTSNARLFTGDQSAPTPQSPALQDNKFIPALTRSLKKLVGKDFPQTSPARP